MNSYRTPPTNIHPFDLMNAKAATHGKSVEFSLKGLARMIRARREAKGLTIADCARQVGISHTTWHRFEKERVGLKVEVVEKMMLFLGIKATVSYS